MRSGFGAIRDNEDVCHPIQCKGETVLVLICVKVIDHIDKDSARFVYLALTQHNLT
jgi:hypothetical protein